MHKLPAVHMLLQEPGSGDQQDTHKHSIHVLKHTWKEIFKKGKKNANSSQERQLKQVELFNAVQLGHKFKANILADFCCIAECSDTFFTYLSQKLRYS